MCPPPFSVSSPDPCAPPVSCVRGNRPSSPVVRVTRGNAVGSTRVSHMVHSSPTTLCKPQRWQKQWSPSTATLIVMVFLSISGAVASPASPPSGMQWSGGSSQGACSSLRYTRMIFQSLDSLRCRVHLNLLSLFSLAIEFCFDHSEIGMLGWWG